MGLPIHPSLQLFTNTIIRDKYRIGPYNFVYILSLYIIMQPQILRRSRHRLLLPHRTLHDHYRCRSLYISLMNADLGIPFLIVGVNEDIRSFWAVHCSLNDISLGLDAFQRVHEGLQQTGVAYWTIVELLRAAPTNVKDEDARWVGRNGLRLSQIGSYRRKALIYLTSCG